MTDKLRQFLQAHGFNPAQLDRPAEHGLTPLMRAALLGELALVDELLRAGAGIDLRNHDGNNALWLACVSGRPEVVRRLAAAGIDLDNQNAVNATALMYAASSGKAEMVELLLELGADAKLTNLDGANAGDMASTVACLRLLRHTVR
jgi:uncharacterized protein